MIDAGQFGGLNQGAGDGGGFAAGLSGANPRTAFPTAQSPAIRLMVSPAMADPCALCTRAIWRSTQVPSGLTMTVPIFNGPSSTAHLQRRR